MREDLRTLRFALIICLACSILLSGTAALLKKRQDENTAFYMQKNIIEAFGVSTEGKSREELMAIADERIVEAVIDASTGQIIADMRVVDIPTEQKDKKEQLPIYKWKEDGRITKYAFPISGKGLWGMIYGYLAIQSDQETIAGISFYKHKETPGLGAEIEKEWFRSQFKGKKIYKNQQPLNVEVVKGSIAQLPIERRIQAIDGISGATLTSASIQIIINHDAALYSPYFKTIKEN